jgi:hypothetical protein
MGVTTIEKISICFYFVSPLLILAFSSQWLVRIAYWNTSSIIHIQDKLL